MKKYTILIEKGKDGIFVGSVSSLPGCHSDGETIDELLKNMKEAILLYEEVNSQEIENLDFVGMQTLEI